MKKTVFQDRKTKKRLFIIMIKTHATRKEREKKIR